MGKGRLDQFTLDIEFLLISVVQGVALSTLATASANSLARLEFTTWPYIISAFLIIIIFWSQAIVHALSFIDWPLDLFHTFLYFMFSFIEVVAFIEITDPVRWFACNSVLFIVAQILYIVDLRLITNRKGQFMKTESGKRLYAHIYNEQKREMTTLMPLGVIYNIVALYLIVNNPALFLKQGFHIYLIGIQLIFMLIVLVVSLSSFKKRSRLISEAI